MWGDDDPDDRKPMIWSNMKYDDEEYDVLGKDYAPEKVEFDSDLFNAYKKLFNSRKISKALRLGDFKIELVDDARNLFGFSRSYEDDVAYAYFNNSSESQVINLSIREPYSDVLGHQVLQQENRYQLTLPAKSSAILLKKI
jgi:glycosidase